MRTWTARRARGPCAPRSAGARRAGSRRRCGLASNRCKLFESVGDRIAVSHRRAVASHRFTRSADRGCVRGRGHARRTAARRIAQIGQLDGSSATSDSKPALRRWPRYGVMSARGHSMQICDRRLRTRTDNPCHRLDASNHATIMLD